MSRPLFTKKQIQTIKSHYNVLDRIAFSSSDTDLEQVLRDERREVSSLPIARSLIARYVLCGLQNESPYRTHKHPPLEMKCLLFLRPSHLLALQFGMRIRHHAEQEEIRYEGKPTPLNRHSYRSDLAELVHACTCIVEVYDEYMDKHYYPASTYGGCADDPAA